MLQRCWFSSLVISEAIVLWCLAIALPKFVSHHMLLWKHTYQWADCKSAHWYLCFQSNIRFSHFAGVFVLFSYIEITVTVNSKYIWNLAANFKHVHILCFNLFLTVISLDIVSFIFFYLDYSILDSSISDSLNLCWAVNNYSNWTQQPSFYRKLLTENRKITCWSGSCLFFSRTSEVQQTKGKKNVKDWIFSDLRLSLSISGYLV